MATLDSLKQALRQEAKIISSSMKHPLSDAQYSIGFDILLRGSEWITYQDFIVPELSQLLVTLSSSQTPISVLEIGPGPKSILGYLHDNLRRKMQKYAAFEPNTLFATRLEKWLCSTSETESPLPCLVNPPSIRRSKFPPEETDDERYDIIIFCHSMYGMKPKRKYIERALELLVEGPRDGMVVEFHRNGSLNFDGLVSHQTKIFPTGIIRVANDDEILKCFTSFIAGFSVQDGNVERTIQADWNKVCRTLGRHEQDHPGQLLFSSPTVMVAFTRNAVRLSELTKQVPLSKSNKTVKNRQACFHQAASIIRPTEVRHVQQCISWALKHHASLTISGGGHSDHCIWPDTVSIDMSAFNQVRIVTESKDETDSSSGSNSLIVVETGCKTGDIIREALAANLTVPLGARPSVGAGLWLQGGIGHLARLYGLSCDSIIGAIVVSVRSGQIFRVGNVPSQYQPAGTISPEDEIEMLWAIKGAGTNFGVVISVTFQAFSAPTYVTRNWVLPLADSLEARRRLKEFDGDLASRLPRSCSADAYVYWENDKLHLGVTIYECIVGETNTTGAPVSMAAELARTIWGPENNVRAVDAVGMFDTEMYVSQMHGGHAGGKTSSFKRCLFLSGIGETDVINHLLAAMETRPSPICYLHLLQGGGAIRDVASDATAFGCRDWDFACVITGVWPRDQDGTEAAQLAMQWVYDVAKDLLPSCSGVYGADLGPDPRDISLADKAFGPNKPRLARLKQSLDPQHVLAYACPIPKASIDQKLVFIITGESCVGKDYCAGIWSPLLARNTHRRVTARIVSISDATKREYAAATGADFGRLLVDRAYKEQHRPAMTAFYQEQVQRRPRLPEEHFLNVVDSAADVDVLLITGMRDEAPVASFSHMLPNSRLIEIHVHASEQTRRRRRESGNAGYGCDAGSSRNCSLEHATLNYRPSLTFHNDSKGSEVATKFAERHLLPFLDVGLQRLASMACLMPDFPRPGIDFRHMLGIAQQPGGLALCTSLLQSHFTGEWAKTDVIVCCEAGGFIYASALALQVHIPLVLIREAGKLPPPTIAVEKPTSHVSSLTTKNCQGKMIEMERGVLSGGASVVVVDDVLSTGETLCAILQLLGKAGVSADDVNVMVVAEFPYHRGRELLRRSGFGRVNVQSLLVYGGA